MMSMSVRFHTNAGMFPIRFILTYPTRNFRTLALLRRGGEKLKWSWAASWYSVSFNVGHW